MNKHSTQTYSTNYTLPNTTLHDWHRYRKGILGVLKEVNVNASKNKALREDLKAVYELLSRLEHLDETIHY